MPTEWNALYYIAKLRRSLQERLIQEREIRPTLSVGQARDLFARFHGATFRSRKNRFRERLRRFEDFFLAELPNCSQAEKDLARARLTGLVELIDVPVPYLFTVAAGILPAVDPGIYPPQCDVGFGPARRIVACPWHHQLSKGLCYGGRVLPGGNGVLSEKALAIWRLGPGGKMPPSTAAKLAAATHLLSTVNTYRVPNGNSGFPDFITHISLLTDHRNNL